MKGTAMIESHEVPHIGYAVISDYNETVQVYLYYGDIPDKYRSSLYTIYNLKLGRPVNPNS